MRGWFSSDACAVCYPEPFVKLHFAAKQHPFLIVSGLEEEAPALKKSFTLRGLSSVKLSIAYKPFGRP